MLRQLKHIAQHIQMLLIRGYFIAVVREIARRGDKIVQTRECPVWPAQFDVTPRHWQGHIVIKRHVITTTQFPDLRFGKVTQVTHVYS